MSNTLNFVLASPNEAADKIVDEMEDRIESRRWKAALREIEHETDDAIAIEIARAALAPEQEK